MAVEGAYVNSKVGGAGDTGIYSQSANVSLTLQPAGGLNRCFIRQSMNQQRAQRDRVYLSVLCGMVGSMDTRAPVGSIRHRFVFLQEDTKAA